MTDSVTADRKYVLKHVVSKGIQSFSILSIPVLLVLAWRTKNWSSASLLRKHSALTFTGGGLVGLGLAYGRMRNMEPSGLMDRAERLKVNMGQLRVDSYSQIGAFLGAVTTSAALYGRAPLLFACIPGGASLGVAGGVIAHVAQSLIANETLSPEMMVEEVNARASLQEKADDATVGKDEAAVKER